jgi:hypothetical protein
MDVHKKKSTGEPVPSKDYIFKRGSISISILPDNCFTTVTVELI